MTARPGARAGGSVGGGGLVGAAHGARVRRGAVRVPPDVATRLRCGHPYLFREALGGRPVQVESGELIDLLDETGTFVARGVFDSDGVVAVRVVSRDPEERVLFGDGDWVLRRVQSAKSLRQQLLPLGEGMTALRVLHGEGDQLPGISVDRYGDFLVVHLFSPSLERLREPLLDALELAWRPMGIYEQRRYKSQTGTGPKEGAQLVRGQHAPVEVEVAEHGIRFAVDPTAPLGTGLFPDLRAGRQVVGSVSSGRRVLNLFSYTGAFSVWAARGGATQVVSVDLSAKAHARARRNFALNGLSEAGHEFLAADAFPTLAQLASRDRQFDLIVIDPPPFGQSKGRVFSAQRDYRELVEAALAVAAPGALVACVSNTGKVALEEMDRAIGEAGYRAGRPVRIVDRRGLPADFPVVAGFGEGHYLKFMLCQVD